MPAGSEPAAPNHAQFPTSLSTKLPQDQVASSAANNARRASMNFVPEFIEALLALLAAELAT
jgi:hypothetical protein